MPSCALLQLPRPKEGAGPAACTRPSLVQAGTASPDSSPSYCCIAAVSLR